MLDDPVSCISHHPGSALGDLVAHHPRLTRLALHSNALHGLGGAKLLEGVAENARDFGDGKTLQFCGFGDLFGMVMVSLSDPNSKVSDLQLGDKKVIESCPFLDVKFLYITLTRGA